jgi:hypothetical protein
MAVVAAAEGECDGSSTGAEPPEACSARRVPAWDEAAAAACTLAVLSRGVASLPLLAALAALADDSAATAPSAAVSRGVLPSSATSLASPASLV